MSLIILLILSEDDVFNKGIHEIVSNQNKKLVKLFDKTNVFLNFYRN